MPARNHIDLIVKTMRVLETLARSEMPLELKTIATEAGLVKSSAFRVLYTLRELGYVEHEALSRAYHLSAKMRRMASRPSRRRTLIQTVRPFLMRLQAALDESAWLAERRGGLVVLVDVVEADHPLRLSLDLGDTCPIHATALGKAVAAHLPPAVLDRLLSRRQLSHFTRNTVKGRVDLDADLAAVRLRGFAVNDQESIEGVVIVGAPIFDSAGVVSGAISVSVPTVRCSPEKRGRTIAAVKSTARAISIELARIRFRSGAL